MPVSTRRLLPAMFVAIVVVLLASAAILQSNRAPSASAPSASPATGADASLTADGGGRAAPGDSDTSVDAGDRTARLATTADQTAAGASERPSEIHMQIAGDAVFDVRRLKSTVVKFELPERDPSESGDEDTNATADSKGSDSGNAGDEGTASSVTVPAEAAPAPAPLSSFDGLDFATWGAGHPPDTNGDVGPAYYIETVNTSIGIFNKTTGALVSAFTFNTLMSQGTFGNLCDTNNFGDPVVLYDTFEDRWIITDFAFQLDGSGNIVNPPGSFQCFAVSKTGDPVSGGWNFYSINTTGGLGDYPKFGIWPDGLYMSTNMFNYASGGGFENPRVYAFNKAQMYAGDPSVQIVTFNAPSADFTLIPSNARLQAGSPPAGTPDYFVASEEFVNALTVYKFHVDWDRISLSTFTGPDVPLAATSYPNGLVPNAPSQGGNTLDVLANRAMVQNQYSDIGGVESLWMAHTVQRATSGFAAPRYYQVNVTGGTVAANLVQAATWDPDGANVMYRFLPSVAVDRVGDMAMGYSTSSSTTKPAIKYAGRLATDPVNTFSQTEQTLIQGTGTQLGNCGSGACIRWGDYSSMTLDPDGCTFWYSNEYFATDGLNDLTRIGSFQMPGCTPVGVGGTVSGTVTASAGGATISGATVAFGSRTATTNGSGVYTFSSIPAGTYPAIAVSSPGYAPGAASPVVVADATTTTDDFALTTAATSACLTDTTKSDFQTGVATSCDLTGNPGDVTLLDAPTIDQQNGTLSGSGVGITTTIWGGQTFTPSVTGPMPKADVNLFCSGCTGTTPNLTLSVRATSAGLPTGADLASATITGFSSGAGVYYTGTFAIPPTLTAGTMYALVIRPIANPSPGTYAITRSSTDVYPGGTRVSGATAGTVWSTPLTAGTSTDAGFDVYIEAGFATSGTQVSSLKDANPAPERTPTWTTLSWNATAPTNTGIKFQVAASNSPDGSFDFVGPDTTSATFFTTSGASLSQFNGLRYLKYETYLSTTDSAVTPTLNDVTVCFDDVLPTTTLAVDPAAGTYGQTADLSATLTSDASGLSGKTVTFSLNGSSIGDATTNVSGVASLTAVSLTGFDAGDYPTGVSASFAGDGTHTASSGTADLDVSQASATLTIDPSSLTQDWDGNPKSVTVTTTPLGLSGVSVTYDGSGTAPSDVGHYDVDASLTNANYTATDATGTLDISDVLASQTITFDPLPDKTFGDAAFDVSASASSGLTVTFGVGASDQCTISGATVTLTDIGSCTVTASQSGGPHFAAAADVAHTFAILQADSTTTTTVAAIAPNPTYQFSDTVTLSATVTGDVAGGTVKGTVVFRVGGNPAAGISVPVDAASPADVSVPARLDSDLIAVGGKTYRVTAAFVADVDSDYSSSSGQVPMAVRPEGALATPGRRDGSTPMQYTGVTSVGLRVRPRLVVTVMQGQGSETGDTENVDFTGGGARVRFLLYQIDCATTCPTGPVFRSRGVAIVDAATWATTGHGRAVIRAKRPLPAGTYRIFVTRVINGYLLVDNLNAQLTVGPAKASGFVDRSGAV